MIRKFTYPLNVAEFLVYQEECTGRDLSARERELVLYSAKLTNEAYEDGVDGRPSMISSRTVETFFNENGKPDRLNDPVVRRFFDALIFWMNAAHAAGMEAVV